MKLQAAVIQTRTPADPSAGFAHAAALIEAAAADGATLVLTPEGSNLLQRDRTAFEAAAPYEDDPAALAPWAALAGRLSVTLVVGSLLLRQRKGRNVNRSLVFDPDGTLIARYDKIHLFDVNLGKASGMGAETRESANYVGGSIGVVADTPAAPLGMSICYDLRFGQLYRHLARAGAEIMLVPAAFTQLTGEAHWEPLLRARAIETGSYVLAAAQGGTHEDGRVTWGHSMVVDPWGTVTARLDHDRPGHLVTTLDLEQVSKVRRKIPAWSLTRSYDVVRQPDQTAPSPTRPA